MHEHEHDCCCGHEHEHKHEHDHHHAHEHDHHHDHTDCGCGHDHDHEHHHHDHDDCGCGHDHEHEHHHDHDGCCGHDHEHEHHHHDHNACGCGHDHEHEHHHDHDHDGCCGHDHEHHHEHGDGCGCGHSHDKPEDVATRSHTHFVVEHHHTPGHPEDCDCPQCNPHAEYCDICGESLAKCTCKMPDEDMEKRVYLVEGLDCANCAAKIEAKIRSMPEVAFASLSFTTRQLRVSANNQDELLPKMQAVVNALEDGVTLIPRKRKVSGVSATRTYTLEGLDCANCAAKIEAKLKTMDGVDDVSITFATKQLKLSAKNPDALIPQIQVLINSMEDGVTVVPKDAPQSAEPEKKGMSEEKKSLISIGIGAVLFIVGEVMEHMGAPLPALLGVLIVAYLILGGKVLMTAAKNIKKCQVFDENFLMSIATLGAFAIAEYPEAVGVMLFYRIGEFFEDRAVNQSRKQIMDAVDLRPEVVNLVVGEDIRVIGAEEANVGDILLVRPGDRIPLDGVIIEGESRIDTSSVTGEPIPVKAAVGDNVISGCVNTSGQLKIRVEKLLEESMVTRILDSVENAAANKPAIDKFITRFARVYTPAVVIAALVVALVLPFLIPNWHFFVDHHYTGVETVIRGASGTASILTALTFLVISCPCALVLSVPLAFFSGIGAASKKGILFKGGSAIEALSGIKAVVMDKTGTITKGNFQVQAAIPADNTVSTGELLSLAASCELFSTHPIAVSIVNAAGEQDLFVERPLDVKEIAGHGIQAKTAADTLLCGNRKLMDANNVDLSGYRKTAFGTEVLVARNGRFIGHIVISDTLKDDAVEAVSRIKELGIVTAMLTGDAQDSAEHVAKQTGIDEVHAKLLPENKLSELKKIREGRGSVMFVGDGINDAPVLAGADVGAAMGSGADAAIEAADVVFMNSEMSAIPDAIKIARHTSRISWQNVYFALAVKFVVMLMGLFGFANMWIAVFADTGVSMLCLLNSVRILRMK